MSHDLQETANLKRLREDDFVRLSQFIQKEYGIKLPPSKRLMLESRLNKRLRTLKMDDFHKYVEHVFNGDRREYEIIHMIDLVTTNKTDFFREPDHFDYLVAEALPTLLQDRGGALEFSLWSAGCSTGEEPYTLAMVLSEFAIGKPKFDFRILATDISTRVLEKGKAGVYDEDKVAPVPQSLKKKYLLRSKNSSEGTVRIKPLLREKVSFSRLNLMDSSYRELKLFDAIFCRNVIIYFDRSTQERFIARICKHLKPGGFLFVGHSESLFHMTQPLTQVAPTIYRRSSVSAKIGGERK